MMVEDAISPLQTLVNPKARFMSRQPPIWLCWPMRKDCSAGETVEQTFQHISRYPDARHPAPTPHNSKALLLIVRE